MTNSTDINGETTFQRYFRHINSCNSVFCLDHSNETEQIYITNMARISCMYVKNSYFLITPKRSCHPHAQTLLYLVKDAFELSDYACIEDRSCVVAGFVVSGCNASSVSTVPTGAVVNLFHNESHVLFFEENGSNLDACTSVVANDKQFPHLISRTKFSIPIEAAVKKRMNLVIMTVNEQNVKLDRIVIHQNKW